MTATFRAAGTAGNTGGTTLSIAAPAGMVNGDRIVVFWRMSVASLAPTAPAGWATYRSSADWAGFFVSPALTVSAGPWTATRNAGTASWRYVPWCYQPDSDNEAPVLGAWGSEVAGSVSTSIVAPGVTLPAPALVFGGFSQAEGAASVTPPAGATTIGFFQPNFSNSAYASYRAAVPAGATGNVTATQAAATVIQTTRYSALLYVPNAVVTPQLAATSLPPCVANCNRSTTKGKTTMSPLPLEIGAAADVLVGPIFSVASGGLKNDAVVYNSAGMVLATYTGQTRTVRSLSGTTNADWWFRTAGGDGMYLLRVPAAVILAADAGKGFAVRGSATGNYDFGNYQALMIIDPEAADTLAAIALLSDPAVGLYADVRAMAAPVSQEIADKVYKVDITLSGTTYTVTRDSDGAVIVTKTASLGARNPVNALT